MNAKVLVLSIALALQAVVGLAQTVINTVPYTISSSGNYVLGGNLAFSGASGVAISVITSNVTIDMNGYYLWCSTSSPTDAVGIQTASAANVTIKNGQFINFTIAILCSPGSPVALNSGHLIQNVRFTGNATGVTVVQGSNCVVTGCQFVNGSQFALLFSSGATGNRGVSNSASLCQTGYFSFSGSNYFESDYANQCSVGFDLLSTDKVRFCTTTGCTTPFLPSPLGSIDAGAASQ